MPSVPRSVLAAALATGLLASAANAIAPEQVVVVRQGSAYSVRMSIEVHAPAVRVREFLTDYANLHLVNPAVISSEVLPAPMLDVTRVRTHLKSCIWFFCREFDLVEDVRTDPAGDISAEIVAQLSDMKSGSSRWSIREAGDSTQLTYESTMDPDFWVPPLIGPRAIMRSLRENLMVTAENLERLSEKASAAPASR